MMNKGKYQSLTAIFQYSGIRLNLKMVLYFKNLIELNNQKKNHYYGRDTKSEL